jgi:hypothetical protein
MEILIVMPFLENASVNLVLKGLNVRKDVQGILLALDVKQFANVKMVDLAIHKLANVHALLDLLVADVK